jgi:hypothetical protein
VVARGQNSHQAPAPTTDRASAINAMEERLTRTW